MLLNVANAASRQEHPLLEQCQVRLSMTDHLEKRRPQEYFNGRISWVMFKHRMGVWDDLEPCIPRLFALEAIDRK